jgi:HlyD family secretion protein
MPQSYFREAIGLAIVVAAMVVGCDRSSEKKASQSAQGMTTVEVVRPQRRTVRRTVGEPGQLEAYEITPINAKVSGYVRRWTVDIGTKVKRGQMLAILSVPELDAEAEQKQAMVEESQANLAQMKASEKVAQANLASAEVKLEEVQAGIKRVDADLSRWQAEYGRVEQLFNERAQTGTLLADRDRRAQPGG